MPHSLNVLGVACFVTGIAQAQNFDDEVAALEQKVLADPKYTKLTSDLMAYAAEAIETNKSAIKRNLAMNNVTDIDLLWPGNGYNQVAYGGQYEVLSLLQKMGMFNISKIMGASGGAASTILALADGNLSSRTILKYNYVYAESKEASDPQILRETELWTAIYKSAIGDDAAFNHVKNRGRVACLCHGYFPWRNDVFYNFTSREQCAKAYYASGDLSAGGLVVGTRIPNFREVGSCSDGGSVTYFPDSAGALLYYSAMYDYTTTKPTAETMNILFRHGVDETIQLLKSRELLVESSAWGYGGMQMVLPGFSGKVGEEEYAPLQQRWDLFNGKAFFYNVGASTASASESLESAFV